MNAIEIDSIGGFCPCQASGKIHGNPFYFRARHGEWTLEVARPGEDPICNPSIFYKEGDDVSFGSMAISEAMQVLGFCYAEFHKQFFNQIYKGDPYPPNPEASAAAKPSDV